MKNQVKVAVHPETKVVITKNENKPEFGTIRLDQEVITMENGFLNRTKRSSFLTGKLLDLQTLGFKEGQVLSGKIVRKESFEPMFVGHTPKINPTSKEEVLIGGKKVYFQDTYTEDETSSDILVSSNIVTKKAELKPAFSM